MESIKELHIHLKEEHPAIKIAQSNVYFSSYKHFERVSLHLSSKSKAHVCRLELLSQVQGQVVNDRLLFR